MESLHAAAACRWDGGEWRLDDERLQGSLAVGTFDLPPIPLGRLPETRSGLPGQNPENGHRASESLRARFPNTHVGTPLCDYDHSNCQPQQSLDAALPPLPPSACRLPQRTHREAKSNRPHCEVARALESPETPFPHVVIVWATENESLAKSSGERRWLQQGTPILLSFAEEENAVVVHEALLTHRAAQLKGRTASSGRSRASRAERQRQEEHAAHPEGKLRNGEASPCEGWPPPKG